MHDSADTKSQSIVRINNSSSTSYTVDLHVVIRIVYVRCMQDTTLWWQTAKRERINSNCSVLNRLSVDLDSFTAPLFVKVLLFESFSVRPVSKLPVEGNGHSTRTCLTPGRPGNKYQRSQKKGVSSVAPTFFSAPPLPSITNSLSVRKWPDYVWRWCSFSSCCQLSTEFPFTTVPEQ